MLKRLAVLFLLLWCGLPALAQLSSKRCKWVKISARAFSLDSLTISPGTVTIFNASQQEIPYQYNPTTNLFSFTDSVAADSVLICYRVLPLNLSRPYYRRSLARMDSVSFERAYAFEDFSVKEELFKTPGLNKSGTYTRGLSFGNTQNVFVNSALNLQLEGRLSEDISIIASITDQNIPFQPEGNTQQLQEFDKVFITLQHKRWSLTGGDIVLRNKPSSFLRFYKNVQGGALDVLSAPHENKNSNTTVAAGVAKGKFLSQTIPAIESVQGPYRLSGVNGEKFIIILANSERVYLDGRLMTRGYDFDYVIDYNQAEITFTPKNLITRNTRIRVDFEYSDQNYSRSITHLNHYQTVNKLKVQVNYYNEADNPNYPNQTDLNPDQKRLLSQIGDDLSKAFVPGADSVAFSDKLVLYELRDTTLTSGQTFRIYKFSSDPSKAFYSLRFTDLGQGGGDYVQDNVSVNGRVFKWVEPLNGIPQGRYAPIRRLPVPIKKQMMTAAGSYQVNKETNVYLETAASQYDQNRFSTIGSADDKGKAIKVGYDMLEKEFRQLGAYRLRSTVNFEYTEKNFEPIDRYRDIEFDRDWSLPTTSARADDNILNLSAGLTKNEKNLVNYRISRRYRQEQINGFQHWLDGAKQLGKLELKGTFFLLNNTIQTGQSDWFRGDAGMQLNWNKVVPGYIYRFDKNKLTGPTSTDSVTGSAVYFDEHVFFLQNGDSNQTRFRVDYVRRDDRQVVEGEFRPRDLSHTYNASVTTRLGKMNDLNVLFTYREVSTAVSPEKRETENTVLSKADWTGDLLDRHLRSELSYAVATGREQKREYIFVETVHGQGTHYLIPDSDPKNLNNYVEAQTSEIDKRTHIKVFLPTDNYIIAFTNQFTYRLSASLPRRWEGQNGWRGFASRFNTISYLNIDKKTTDKKLGNRLNPFSKDIEDLDLISFSQSIRNTLYFNRSNPKYGLEYTWQKSQQKVLLSNGTDTRNINTQSMTGRYNLTEIFASKFSLENNVRENASNYLTTKNFRVVTSSATPELAWQPNTNFRLTGNYAFSFKQNTLGTEEAIFNEIGLETRLSQVSKRTVTGIIKFVKIGFTGDENSVVSYEILNTLRPGNNATWNLAVQQRLRNGLNITLQYDGRKPDAIPAVHTGRAQVSVLF